MRSRLPDIGSFTVQSTNVGARRRGAQPYTPRSLHPSPGERRSGRLPLLDRRLLLYPLVGAARCSFPMTSTSRSSSGTIRHASAIPCASSSSETWARLMGPLLCHLPLRTATLHTPQPPLRHPTGIALRPMRASAMSTVSVARQAYSSPVCAMRTVRQGAVDKALALAVSRASGIDLQERFVQLSGVIENSPPELLFGPGDHRHVGLSEVAESGESLVAIPGRIEEVGGLAARDPVAGRRDVDAHLLLRHDVRCVLDAAPVVEKERDVMQPGDRGRSERDVVRRG